MYLTEAEARIHARAKNALKRIEYDFIRDPRPQVGDLAAEASYLWEMLKRITNNKEKARLASMIEVLSCLADQLVVYTQPSPYSRRRCAALQGNYPGVF